MKKKVKKKYGKVRNYCKNDTNMQKKLQKTDKVVPKVDRLVMKVFS